MLPRGREVDLKPSLGCWKALGASTGTQRRDGTEWMLPWNSRRLLQHAHPRIGIATYWPRVMRPWEAKISWTVVPVLMTQVLMEDEKGESVQIGKKKFRGGKTAWPFLVLWPPPSVPDPRQSFSFSSKELGSKVHHISQCCLLIPNALSIKHFSIFQYLYLF